MRILNISSSVGIGGREMLVLTISNHLRARGNDVKIITKKNTWLDKTLKQNNFEVYPFIKRKYVDPLAIYKLGKLLTSYKPDVVHLYYISDIWLVVPAVKIFYPNCKIFLLRSMVSSPMKDKARTKLFNALNKVIVMSGHLRKDFLSKTLLDPAKIETLYIGVDLNLYDEAKITSSLRKEYDISDDIDLVGLVGRIDKGKGQDKLIYAASEILKYKKNVKFVIIGSSEAGSGIEYENHLKKIIQDLGISDHFIFTGFRSDVPNIMHSLDIVVFPSQEEAFGLVVIEAMASGKPVVGYNTGAFPEIIEDGVNGYIVPYTIPDLADGILKLIDDREKRVRFGETGRKRVHELFSIETTIDKLLELYSCKDI